jgi:hypothetical protein
MGLLQKSVEAGVQNSANHFLGGAESAGISLNAAYYLSKANPFEIRQQAGAPPSRRPD